MLVARFVPRLSLVGLALAKRQRRGAHRASVQVRSSGGAQHVMAQDVAHLLVRLWAWALQAQGSFCVCVLQAASEKATPPLKCGRGFGGGRSASPAGLGGGRRCAPSAKD